MSRKILGLTVKNTKLLKLSLKLMTNRIDFKNSAK